ncbi:MFS transporter [Phytoactinopolyspora limicola]|uniref:MFS transporter n=1 Tax=Phytoactinopolyspora limicola TaxID=2715536 RepID=UPI001FECD2EB|nr:MFS transporter [Phytoactinopolyspora limicola]
MSTAPGTKPGERAGLREWIGLAVLALPTILIALDLTVLYMALPHLGADLGASNTQMLWMTDIYGFMVAGLLITMGTLGDRIGRRRLLLLGAAAFGAASVLAAYSTSPEMLIGSRMLLGIAGATLMPSTLSLLSNMFKDPKQRSMAVGVWMMSFAGGGMLGPAVGGFMLEHFWWGSVFLLGVPVMLLLLGAGRILLPEYRNEAPARVDLISVALSLGAILPFVFGIKEIAKNGGVTGGPAAALVVGVVVGVLFVRRQTRLADPLLDLSMFRIRRFSGAVIGLTLAALTLSSFGLFFTQYLQLVEGLSPLRAGLWFLPMGAAVIASSFVAPLLARRIRPPLLITAALAIAAGGLGSLTQLGVESGLTLLITGSVLFGIGIIPLQVLSVDLVVGSVPLDKTGSASATSETGGEFGMAMGIATLGTVGTAAYSSRMEGIIPAGIPDDVASSAQDSFANAFAAAAELPSALGAQLVASANEAFVWGFNVVAALSAALLGGIAVMVMTVLRHVRPVGETDDDPAGADAEGGNDGTDDGPNDDDTRGLAPAPNLT